MTSRSERFGGVTAPRSNLLIADKEKPESSATCAWVSPLASRADRIWSAGFGWFVFMRIELAWLQIKKIRFNERPSFLFLAKTYLVSIAVFKPAPKWPPFCALFWVKKLMIGPYIWFFNNSKSPIPANYFNFLINRSLVFCNNFFQFLLNLYKGGGDIFPAYYYIA